MRLKKIKLAGFKSFVDLTVLDLPSQLIGVVGPNGCGKSNVIDAVRWVMGESSAKNLRGESLSDVIFNGSTSRKPVGQASIELIFDNSEGSLGGEYANYVEISIRRVATRDNQSNYFLNGTRCRRKDITDIFLGTGLGPRSYSIIEQGMISRVIEAKPEDLRGFLEEAAGISLYRKRRQETETRMRHTRENLDRVNDVIQELDKQLERLKRQSESAERYKEYKQEHDQCEAELETLRWRSLDGLLQERSERVRTESTRLEQKLAERSHIDLELETLREKHSHEAAHCNTIQSQFYDLSTEISRCEQTLQNHRDRHIQLQKDLQQSESALQHLNEQLGLDTQRLETLEQELALLAPENEILVEQTKQARSHLTETEQAVSNWEMGFETFQKQAELPQRTSEVEKARIEQLEKQTRELESKIKRLLDEQQHLSAVSTEEKVVSLEIELHIQEREQEHRAETLTSLSSALEDARQLHETLMKQLDQIRNENHIKQGRLVSLEALQQAALGKTDSTISAWLESADISDKTRMAQHIKVEAGYETAVETVLGSALEAVCVNGFDTLFEKLSSLSEGNLTLLETASSSAPQDRTDLNRTDLKKGLQLASKIKTDLPIGNFCDGIYVVDELSQALQLRPQLSTLESVVTRDGIWCGRHWIRVHRGANAKSGILARESEIKHLKEALVRLDTDMNALETQYQDNRRSRSALEQEREALLKVEQSQGQNIKTLSTKLSTERSRIEHIRNRLSVIQEEITEQKQKQRLIQEEVMLARASLQSAINEMADFSQRRTALLEERDNLRSILQRARVEVQRVDERLHAFSLKQQGLKSQTTATMEGITRIKQHCVSHSERTEFLKTSIEECSEPQQGLRETLETLLSQRIRVEQDLSAARSSVNTVDHTLRSLEKQRIQLEHEVDKLRTELENLRLDWQALEVRRQTVQEKLTVLAVDIEQVLSSLVPDANESEWSLKLEQITNKIQRLGAINLAAIEEYQSESERRNYLDAQFQDLTKALETLSNAIHKIDKETRSRFKEVFEKVNHEFQTLFPRLFGGGQACLELLGEDLLEAGVSVMARPPGKRNSSIHLLSGGEKALTAVALVFAIFQLNPAPFCMLDEVDAPLDDANVVRFCNLVKQLSTSVQFIYITHNKVTMEMAQHLVGVTMKEPGVSRLVSVNVAEAVEMATA